MKRYKSSNKVLALASALTAISFGYTFDSWCNNDRIASAKNVDAREVWQMAMFKANKNHDSRKPDPTPTTPNAQTAPMPKKPNVVKMAKVSYVRRLNSLGIRDERVWCKCDYSKKIA